MTQARIPAQPPENWGPDVMAALSTLRAPGAPARAAAAPPAVASSAAPPEPAARPNSNILGIFSWHPALMEGWFAFNNHIFNSTLSARLRELVTVRIAWLRRGEYEWAQHVRMAKAVGMTDAEVDAISEGPDAAIWGPADAAVLRAVDQLSTDHYIDDALWAELTEQFNRQEMMDLVFTVGAYDLLCVATNNFGLQLDPGLPGFPAGERK